MQIRSPLPVSKNVDVSDIHTDKPLGGDSIPLQRCDVDGSPCWRWGDSGKAYPFNPDDPNSEKEAKEKAISQGVAMGEMEKCGRKDDDLADEDYLNRTMKIRKEWEVPIIKAEQMIVYGVVSEPHTVDLQGDRLSPDEIEKAAHGFMINSRRVNKGHGGPAAADVLESFIAPGDFVVNGQQVRKGSWVMAVRVKDPGVWESIKKGEITGFSIGGRGRRVPLTSQS